MTIQFNLEYPTRWGQKIYLCGSLPALGTNCPENALPLEFTENNIWSTTISVPDDTPFTYRYLVREAGKSDLIEPGTLHHLENTTAESLAVFDQWQAIPTDLPFYSSAFTDCIFHSKIPCETSPILPDTITFRCFAPTLQPGQIPALCGDTPASGNWDPTQALPLTHTGHCEWQVSLPRQAITFPFNFKFILIEAESGTLSAWEEGANHTIPTSPQTSGKTLLFAGFHLRDPRPLWKGAGVAIPVFSLRSSKGYGIGEFTDLIPLIDWAVETGQKVIQILPVNDTTMTHTWHDSYPYNANSIFALHPAYIHLEEAGILKDAKKMETHIRQRDRLNQLSDIDYEQVTAGKWNYLRALFEETGSTTLQSAPFKRFFQANQEWLIPYAAFSYLRDKYETPDFHWWENHSTYDPEEISQMADPHSAEYPQLAFHFFVQFHLDRQLSAVSKYAREKGIVLKGDIPIGISRTSVDAWVNPGLFHMDSQAGAPPDDFSRQGQNWGFPTYNWEVMKSDHYAWWKKRFSKMADYFDAYRIDHILGFFRIWEIPIKATQGILGHFHPALPFTAEEIRTFGFDVDPTTACAPFIREYFLYNLFGDATEEVKSKYLDPAGDGSFRMKKEFDTQLEIQNYFEGQADERAIRIREGLLRLVADVLFVATPQSEAGGAQYHPRIAAQDTQAYQALTARQKQAFDRLYNHFFYERHNQFWCNEAMEKLPPLLSATRMLACGEDLGMIPAGVAQVMDQLRILRLEIQRMPKKEGALFDDPATYPYLSVCTTSTHDMSTLRGWWKENSAVSQQYYNQMLHQEGWKPDDCTPAICEQIIRQHLQSPAMLTILPWQDWLAIDDTLRNPDPGSERINMPAVSRYYWRYRMHIPLEQLTAEHELNQKIKSLISTSGR